MKTRREMAAKLGELLSSRGKLDREVLLRALRAQRNAGGRLGTLLLEIDAVGEEDLLSVLSDQLKVPFVEPEDLRTISPETLRLVPAKTAAKLCAVPVRASTSQLVVAMRDPLDLAALDELAFVSGRRIRAHVALECRLQEALSKHYGIDTPTRYVKLADRLNRAKFLWRNREEGPASEGPAETPPPATPGILVGERTAPAPPPARPEPPAAQPVGGVAPRPLPPMPSAPPPVTAPPVPNAEPAARPRGPLSFEEAESRLLQPLHRDAVAEALIDFLNGRVDVGLSLMVRRDDATGWRGCGLPHDVAAAVRMPLSEPSIVLALREGAPMHRGPLSPLRGNGPLIAAIGANASDLLALPLRIRDRLVGVLIALQRRGTFEPGLAEDLQRLTVKASGALELLVLRQKLEKA